MYYPNDPDNAPSHADLAKEAWEAEHGPSTTNECNWCGEGPLVYLGSLGRMTHWRCQACGSDTNIPAYALDEDLTEAIAELGY